MTLRDALNNLGALVIRVADCVVYDWSPKARKLRNCNSAV